MACRILNTSILYNMYFVWSFTACAERAQRNSRARWILFLLDIAESNRCKITSKSGLMKMACQSHLGGTVVEPSRKVDSLGRRWAKCKPAKPGTGRMVTVPCVRRCDIDHLLFLYIPSKGPLVAFVGHHHHVSVCRRHKTHRNQPTIRRPTIGIHAPSNCAAGGVVHYYQRQGHLPGRFHLLL